MRVLTHFFVAAVPPSLSVAREKASRRFDGMRTVGDPPALSDHESRFETLSLPLFLSRLYTRETRIGLESGLPIHPDPTRAIGHRPNDMGEARTLADRARVLLPFVDRGVTRYGRVTRYILQHEEAYHTAETRPGSLDIEELCRVARA